jgi:hypothetical protein
MLYLREAMSITFIKSSERKTQERRSDNKKNRLRTEQIV